MFPCTTWEQGETLNAELVNLEPITGVCNMIKSEKIWIFFSALALLGVCSTPVSVYGANGCGRADDLFQMSTTQTDAAAQKSLLEEAVGLCPEHAPAWNNLGLIYEDEGQVDKAEAAYRKSNQYRPDLGAPLAGLGDIAMMQGRFREAAEWYEQFLAVISQGLQNGDPQGLGPYEEEYREKYEQARLKWGIHKDSMTGVVSKNTLTRAMRSIVVKKRPVKPLGPERLALSILFDFGSVTLKLRGRAQLAEIAASMLSDELRDNRFAIEGHTDTYGTYEYNLDLSRKRAEEVRAFLISKGVDVDRLAVRSLGKTRPIISSGSKDEQAVNRRVEFIKMEP